MPTSGLGFNDTFGSGGGSGSGMSGTPFSGLLDGSGILPIAVANANTYDVAAFFQEDPTFNTSLLARIDPTNTTLIKIKSKNDATDAGKRVAGHYNLTPA